MLRITRGNSHSIPVKLAYRPEKAAHQPGEIAQLQTKTDWGGITEGRGSRQNYKTRPRIAQKPPARKGACNFKNIIQNRHAENPESKIPDTI